MYMKCVRVYVWISMHISTPPTISCHVAGMLSTPRLARRSASDRSWPEPTAVKPGASTVFGALAWAVSWEGNHEVNQLTSWLFRVYTPPKFNSELPLKAMVGLEDDPASYWGLR